MAYTFSWNRIPEEMRYGRSPDHKVRLFRGFAPYQYDPIKGMVSDALDTGAEDVVLSAIRAVERGDIGKFIGMIDDHASTNVYRRENGIITPFVSSTPEIEIAERYARNSGERIAEILVSADRIVSVPLLPYEALVIGGIAASDIVSISEAQK